MQITKKDVILLKEGQLLRGFQQDKEVYIDVNTCVSTTSRKLGVVRRIVTGMGNLRKRHYVSQPYTPSVDRRYEN